MGAISYGPYGFRELVRQHVKLHADHIKILATGGVLSYGDVWDIPQFNLDKVRAVVEESTKFPSQSRGARARRRRDFDCRRGRRKLGRARDRRERENAAADATARHQSRADDLGAGLDPPTRNPNRIPPTSLQKAKYAAGLRDEGMHRAIASSVMIACGADAGVFPHDQNNKDFALLVRLGMRPIDVLRSATFDAAELIGITDRGRLARGTFADVVVFNGDPTTRIGVMERPPALVMLGGRKIDAARLPG